MRLCVDCAKRQPQNEDLYNDDWIYSYRNSYYSTGYLPFRFGRQDHESFSDLDDLGEDWDDDYAGDFNDS